MHRIYIKGDFEYDKPPIVSGHEGSGIVVKTGDNVGDVKPGDKVVIDYVLGCGECFYCKEGFENRCLDGMY